MGGGRNRDLSCQFEGGGKEKRSWLVLTKKLTGGPFTFEGQLGTQFPKGTKGEKCGRRPGGGKQGLVTFRIIGGEGRQPEKTANIQVLGFCGVKKKKISQGFLPKR